MASEDRGIAFRCSSGCNVCCITRGYPQIDIVRDPNTRSFVQIKPESMGKEGMVEVEAWELPKMLKLAKKLSRRVDEKGKPIQYRFLPARAVGPLGAKAPEQIISYWLMGRFEDGDMCPFLSTPAEDRRTEDGMLKCLIYDERPLQCRAYPVHQVFTDRITGEKMVELDKGCQRVMEMLIKGERRVGQPIPLSLTRGLDHGAMARLHSGYRFDPNQTAFWAYPTGVFGEGEKPDLVIDGWAEVRPG